MKIQILSIAIAIAISAGAAHAGDSQLGAVNVHPATGNAKSTLQSTVDCTPPNTAQECSAFHRDIRRNFSRREIGMLFGASSAYPEARSGYDRVAARFEAFARSYDDAHLTAFASK